MIRLDASGRAAPFHLVIPLRWRHQAWFRKRSLYVTLLPMTAILLMLGDSLIDSGIVSRASDGLVLGEQIALRWGDLANHQLFPIENLPTPCMHGSTTTPIAVLNRASVPSSMDKGALFLPASDRVKAARRYADFTARPRMWITDSAGANDVLSMLERQLVSAVGDPATV